MAIASPYYPPRARWYSPLRDGWYYLAQRAPNIRGLFDGLDFPLSLRDSLLSLVLPGFVFRAFGHRRIGDFAMAGCAAGWLIFFAWLGTSAATTSFALLLALHVTSLSFMLAQMQVGRTFLVRILGTFCGLLILTSVYGYFQTKLGAVILPLRNGSSAVVVRVCAPGQIETGDWIAYRIGSATGSFEDVRQRGSVRIANGYGLERVVAGPGDVIQFHRDSYQVNGRNLPSEPNMPLKGEIVLSPKQWFAWPQFGVQNYGVHKTEISNVMLGYAIISENQFVGKPFKRWFGRRQILP